MRPLVPDGSPCRRNDFRAVVIIILLFSLSLIPFKTPSFAADDQASKAVRRAPSEIGAGDVSAEVRIGELYALVVGVSRYKDQRIPQLNVSDKDARDFAGFLKTQSKLFKSVHVDLLENEQATKQEVEKHLYYKLRRAGKDDTVVLFFSGHGADDPNTPGEFVFLTYDADPEYLTVTAVQMSRQWFLQKLDSKRVLLIADACHAGGFSGQGVKSIAPSFQNVVQQFKESEGRVFLTSSRPDELSKEKPEAGNSIFTYYLLEGLKGEAADTNGVVTLKALYDYVYSRTKEETKGFQRPQMEGRLVGLFPLALAGTLGDPSSSVRPQVASLPPSAPPAQISDRSLDYREKAERLVTLVITRDRAALEELDRMYKDPEAVKWFRQAAEKGDPVAQKCLGDMYKDGVGVLPKDPPEAVIWYKRAADQGFAPAQANMGNAYQFGSGVTKNYEEAMKWYKKADNQGNATAQSYLAQMYHYGDGVSQDYKEAAKLYRKAAEQGDVPSLGNLGYMYRNGYGVPKDYEKAVKWYRKAADRGSLYALGQLGEMYEGGHGVPKDRSEAIKWFKKAADRGDAWAKSQLSRLGADEK